MASMLWASTGISSLWRDSRRVSARRAVFLASSGVRSSTALTAGLLLLVCVRIRDFFPSALLELRCRLKGRRGPLSPRVDSPFLGWKGMQNPVQVRAAYLAVQRWRRARQRPVSLRMLAAE